MAIIGSITVNEIMILEVDASPEIDGIDAPVGSLAILTDGNGLFQKVDGGPTSWQLSSSSPGSILSVLLTGFAVGPNSPITATDSILDAFEKAQGQINFRVPETRAINAGSGLTGGGDLSADRTLNVVYGTPIAQSPDQPNSAGVSDNVARADHGHNIPTAIAVGLDANSINAQGAAASFARSNHTHAIASGVVSTQTPDQTNAAGTSTNFSRADHIHNIPTATPTTITTASANTQGAAASFARSNHIHKVEVAYQTASATGDTTTTSTAFTLLPGMTITPAAGTYLCFFSSTTSNGTNNAIVYAQLVVGGVQQAASEVSTRRANNLVGATMAISGFPATVNGAQSIEIHWRVSAGTGTSHDARHLTIVRVA